MRRSVLLRAAALVAAAALAASGLWYATGTARVLSVPATTSRTAAPARGACPVTGHITYTLAKAGHPTAEQRDAYQRITTAMDQALALYNCYVPATKALSVGYVPSVTTADANYDGSIRFGDFSTMQQVTAMHEIAHALGVGTFRGWAAHLPDGVWTGPAANAELQAITFDRTARLHGDGQHFWPYGLNYATEVNGTGDLVAHCRIVAALRRDLGL